MTGDLTAWLRGKQWACPDLFVLSSPLFIIIIINRFFKGVFRMNPPRPQYDETWDVNIVFNEIEKWYPLE